MKHYTFKNAAIRLAGGRATREFLEPIYIDRKRELLIVALCDEEMRLMQLVSFTGNEAYVRVTLAQVLRRAVCGDCAGFVLAHNHPSGDTRPSADNIALTKRLGMAAEALDIVFLDHLIFDGEPCFSFRERGYL